MAKQDNRAASGNRKKPTAGPVKRQMKTKVSQTDIPRFPLSQALKLAQSIADNYAGAPTKPMHVASSINMTMNSSNFRMLAGSSSSYGLTTGSWDSATINLTDLGRRATVAKREEEQRATLREAFIRPRIIGQFLKKYHNNRLPSEKVAGHVLEEMGLPSDSTAQAYALIVRGAADLGLLHENKGSQFVDLDGLPTTSKASDSDSDADEEAEGMPPIDDAGNARLTTQGAVAAPAVVSATVNNRVFITHGKNLAVVNQLKELLTFGNLAPVVAAEHETVSKPVPDKVMDDMRSCAAAIIHVGKEIKLLDVEGKEHVFINQNVLIEIGAAMALYGRRFILLVERGANLPSNLQGLYEVRYEGEKLDYDATMKLLKAFNEFKR